MLIDVDVHIDRIERHDGASWVGDRRADELPIAARWARVPDAIEWRGDLGIKP